MDRVRTGTVVPTATFTNCIPLRFRPLERDTPKRGAMIEHPLPYARHAIGDRDTRKRGAIIERRAPYARYTVADRDRRYSTAIIERTIRDISSLDRHVL